MPRAVELRLRTALEEYVHYYKGDNPRGNVRGNVDPELIRQAEALTQGLGTGRETRETPGSAAAAQTRDPSAARSDASQRARELLGSTGAAAGDGER